MKKKKRRTTATMFYASCIHGSRSAYSTEPTELSLILLWLPCVFDKHYPKMKKKKGRRDIFLTISFFDGPIRTSQLRVGANKVVNSDVLHVQPTFR